MKYLPIGLSVRGQACVVLGGGPVGTRKVRNLLEAGARVRLISPRATAELEKLATEGRVDWERRSYRKGDFHGALLAVVATDDEEMNRRAVADAGELGILVCDASSEERTQVIFGALHRGNGLTVAVFTDGHSPTRSRTARDAIARFLEDEGEGHGPGEK